MIEQVLPNLYRIEVPLPKSPLKAINSYIIKNEGRSLIIDTGQKREECMTVLSSGLRELDIDLSKADFFITHLHSDHLGLVSSLATDTSNVYFNQPDAAVMGAVGGEERSHSFALRHGFPEEEFYLARSNHPGYKYGSRANPSFHILKEGDTLSIERYTFECIETPGHTRGHTCLYERNKKIFISGDHILNNITPNISLWSDDGNPLGEYLKSLDKVYDFDVAITLPGHRGIFKDFKGRIKELRHHHELRVDEVLSILEGGRKDAFQVAASMTWDINYKSWEQFPPQQKWFAFGEALSHLKYLENMGKVLKESQRQGVVYSIR